MNILSDAIGRLRFALLKQVAPVDAQGFQRYQRRRLLRNNILHYYAGHPSSDESVTQAVEYLKTQPQAVFFTGPFKDKYNFRDVVVDVDQDGFPFWTTPEGRRLFFLRQDCDRVRIAINHLLIEQDEHSPHRYLTDRFNVGPNDILADVGSAEGILSLQLVEKVKHVYLFESEKEWIEVLHKTFAPWREKVTIVQALVSDHDGDGQLRLDNYFKNEGVMPTFVKLDVEGAEMRTIRGMQGLIETGKPVRLAACTYHLYDEYRQITSFLKERGWTYETSEGWMLFGLYDQHRPPYFRHGLVRVDINGKSNENKKAE